MVDLASQGHDMDLADHAMPGGEMIGRNPAVFEFALLLPDTPQPDSGPQPPERSSEKPAAP
ncbi:hypothetical protein ACFVOR_36775 [Streptomyces sp. NPDC057837]|uniref:hypothetical protein n=1 Tax=Streptomyces sp. NPDC057837 TaxID=3346260 RepID=UPI00367AA9AF